jgi:hypothetical protein
MEWFRVVNSNLYGVIKMAITLIYDIPAEGQLRISGTYETVGLSNYFSCPVIYNGGNPDLAATEARTKLAIQESLDSETI